MISLSLSALLVSLTALTILLFSGRLSKFTARAEAFNKIGTSLALCTAATWVLVQGRDADRLNVDQEYDLVKTKDRMNLFISATVKNDGESPATFADKSFAVWIDRIFPVGENAIESLTSSESLRSSAVVPAVRIRHDNTVAMSVSKSHQFSGSNSVKNIIDKTDFPDDLKKRFFDDEKRLEIQLDPGSTSMMIFWTSLPCTEPAVYVSRFEFEVKRPWYETAWYYIENDFMMPNRIYSIHKKIIDLTAKCPKRV